MVRSTEFGGRLGRTFRLSPHLIVYFSFIVLAAGCGLSLAV